MPIQIPPELAAALNVIAKPLAELALEELRQRSPADYARFAQLLEARDARLHCDTILSADPLKIVIMPVIAGEAGDPLAEYNFDGGAIWLTPEGARFN